MSVKTNISVDQGTTFDTSIDVIDENGASVDLTGYSATAQIRKHFLSNTFYSFDTSVDNDLGTVSLRLTPNTTNNMDPGRYQYDCELVTGDGTTTRLVEGIITIRAQVTRWQDKE